MITVLVSPAELAGGRLELAGPEHHHLFRVRRLGAGERLRLVDGEGHARWAVVEAVGRASATLCPGEPAPSLEPARRVELAVAPPRPERASWLVEKATELGVAAIHFVGTERDPRRIGAGSLDRLRRVAAAALAQSGGATLPRIDGVHPFAALAGLAAPLPARAFLDPGAAPWEGFGEPQPLLLAIGPEGGWSDAERAALAAAGLRAVGLGARVLRVETAAVAALSLALAPRAAAR
jgi:16S rRNA (uracil1498-N3)-methyltransferase